VLLRLDNYCHVMSWNLGDGGLWFIVFHNVQLFYFFGFWIHLLQNRGFLEANSCCVS
jgi:hypothetical protein